MVIKHVKSKRERAHLSFYFLVVRSKNKLCLNFAHTHSHLDQLIWWRHNKDKPPQNWGWVESIGFIFYQQKHAILSTKHFSSYETNANIGKLNKIICLFKLDENEIHWIFYAKLFIIHHWERSILTKRQEILQLYKKNLYLSKLKISSSVPKFLDRWIGCSHQTTISFPSSNLCVPFYFCMHACWLELVIGACEMLAIFAFHKFPPHLLFTCLFAMSFVFFIFC